MSDLSLLLFGPPNLEIDGTSVHIPRRKATALLAHLAVTGQSHSRDALATLLWPENDQSSARAELRRTLSVIKRKLGEDWLRSDRETVVWSPDPEKIFWLDVADFQDKLKVCENHDHPTNTTCPVCLPILEEAVELYTDDFMAGFSLKDCPAYDEWQFFQAEKLRRLLQEALVQLSTHYASILEYESAIQYARRWLALDPLQEAAHRQMMSLFWQSGQRAAALRQYEQCKQTLMDEVRVEPSEETKELYQRIQTSERVSAITSRPKSNLPTQTTPFIGRSNELSEIRAKLQEKDCRLLTLLGPGGSGKTRLAIEVAGGLIADFKQGVFFVNLAPLEDPARIPRTIASALSFSFYKEGTSEEQLLDYLRNKELLLILDNFEHILAGVNLVNKILNEAPGVTILATSRTSLDVSCENIFDVRGMAYPESPAAVQTTTEQYSAVKLFESAAKRRQASFELSDENIPDVVRTCALVDGMPLGIVLAASWAKMLNPKEIATEIARDLTFLEKDLQDLPERQRGVRSVFNHSWRLLSKRERQILSTLSIFRGGFTHEAAGAVAGALLSDLMSLIDNSILHRSADGRFEIHELLRQFASEKLESNPAAAEDIRDKHSDYFCRSLAVWERDLQGSRQIEATQEMEIEIDNIRAAWEWAVERTWIRLLLSALNGLCMFLDQSNQRLEGVAICRSLVDWLDVVEVSGETEPGSPDKNCATQIDRTKLRTRALAWGSLLNIGLGNIDIASNLIQTCLRSLERSELAGQAIGFEKALAYICVPYVTGNDQRAEAQHMAEEAVALFRSLNDPWWVGYSLDLLAWWTTSLDDKTRYFEESLSITRNLGDLRGMAYSLQGLATVTGFHFQFDEAERFANKAMAIYRELDDHHNIMIMCGTLGSILVWEGKFAEARWLYRDTQAIYSDLKFTQSEAASVYGIAGYPDQYLGEYETAVNHAQEALQLFKEVKHLGVPNWTALAIDILGRVALAEGSYLEAEGKFQESTIIHEANEHLENIVQNLACLGFVARGLNQTTQARCHFWNAIKISLGERRFLSLIHTLPGIALLFADQGDVERAVELYALASTQGIVANSKWFEDIAGAEIAQAAEGLSAEVVEAAKARGRALDLWETAEALLTELEQAGWGNADS